MLFWSIFSINKQNTYFFFSSLAKEVQFPQLIHKANSGKTTLRTRSSRGRGYSMSIITYGGETSFSHHQFSYQFSPEKAPLRHAEEHISNVCLFSRDNGSHQHALFLGKAMRSRPSELSYIFKLGFRNTRQSLELQSLGYLHYKL